MLETRLLFSQEIWFAKHSSTFGGLRLNNGSLLVTVGWLVMKGWFGEKQLFLSLFNLLDGMSGMTIMVLFGMQFQVIPK